MWIYYITWIPFLHIVRNKFVVIIHHSHLQKTPEDPEQQIADDNDDIPLLQDVGEAIAEEGDEGTAEGAEGYTKKRVIRMLNSDGTIFEMEDNVVLPDNFKLDDSEDDDNIWDTVNLLILGIV